jgi:hypothetical protein
MIKDIEKKKIIGRCNTCEKEKKCMQAFGMKPEGGGCLEGSNISNSLPVSPCFDVISNLYLLSARFLILL